MLDIFGKFSQLKAGCDPKFEHPVNLNSLLRISIDLKCKDLDNVVVKNRCGFFGIRISECIDK